MVKYKLFPGDHTRTANGHILIHNICISLTHKFHGTKPMLF